ncbi:MAG: hypothetical protein JO045_12960 [Mycobacterium sp.]|nr:hypothetical protein [Mycobacterium sp.]
MVTGVEILSRSWVWLRWNTISTHRLFDGGQDLGHGVPRGRLHEQFGITYFHLNKTPATSWDTMAKVLAAVK